MAAESLNQIGAAFRKWRKKKKFVREAVPKSLIDRAVRAAAAHGVVAVARAAKIPSDRLKIQLDNRSCDPKGNNRVAGRSTCRPKDNRSKPGKVASPGFSRISLAPPSADRSPIAEIETPTGVRVKFFTLTAESVGLLSTMLGYGGNHDSDTC